MCSLAHDMLAVPSTPKTVVPAGAASDMLDTVPLRNVRGLGGKLGEAVVSWSKAETASDLKVWSLVQPCLPLVGIQPLAAGHWPVYSVVPGRVCAFTAGKGKVLVTCCVRTASPVLLFPISFANAPFAVSRGRPRTFWPSRVHQRFNEQDLVGKFGPKTGEWLWKACRGMDDEPVTPNLKPKSLSVCKSFT